MTEFIYTKGSTAIENISNWRLKGAAVSATQGLVLRSIINTVLMAKTNHRKTKTMESARTKTIHLKILCLPSETVATQKTKAPTVIKQKC